MSYVAEFTVPPESFPFGETLVRMPHIEIELDQIIPAGESVLPFFWVRGCEPEEFMAVAETETDVIRTHKLERVEHTALYRAEWQPGTEIIDRLRQLSMTIVEVIGTAESWRFEVRVEDRSELRLFQDIFQADEGEIELVRIHDLRTTIQNEDDPVTEDQRKALISAYENGYFDSPREATLADLSTDFDISSRALSERVRRGTKNLIHSEVIASDED